MLIVAWMVMLPGGVLPGEWGSRLASMKKKLFGGAAQVSAVLAPPVLLTLVMFRLNKVPEPESGTKSFEKAEMHRVLMGPPPGITLPETFQLEAVSPAADTGGFWKVTTVSSKVKSPWNPIRLSEGLMAEVRTGLVKLVTAVETVATGKETVA